MTTHDMDLNACAAEVQRGDPERFAAIMAAPVAARAVMLPIFAFNLEVARAPWVTQEPMIAEMRLQWWRDALDEIASGAKVRRHEVVTPLATVLDADGAKLLDDVVAARRWDVYKDPFADAAQFADYLNRTSGTLLWVACRALGAADGAEQTVRDIGIASGLANWLRAIPALEKSGRVPLVDGRPEAVALLAQQGLERLRSARGPITRGAAWPLLTTWQAGPILKQAARDPGLVAAGGLGISDFSAKSRLLWRRVSGRFY
ncbi:squalene/phytoene synthase family protein [Shimia biformata]|uniref:squalene/phytoene synthase family protein n=1 Tax=Shimia biformata TaxID=1294299 RepID=UPI001EF365CA|nr:squalene/phytoene synthase family protein [Shimia biformata]